MRALIQRVSHASVTVEGERVGEIEKGLLVLLGVGPQDTEKQADFLAEKCAITQPNGASRLKNVTSNCSRHRPFWCINFLI